MIRFVKAHAWGNDFLIVEGAAAGKKLSELAKRLCSRTTGVGADGIEFIERRAKDELFLRLFNSDGTEAELSGNGTRCVAAWLAQSEGLKQVTLGTHGGLRTSRVVQDCSPVYEIESSMGVPRLMVRVIELPGIGAVSGAIVNVGNPHFVVQVETDDFSAYGLKWQELGAKISVSPLFPHGTNVEFVRMRSLSEIDFRIFERGCGPTSSSGTGTCASATAAMSLYGAARELTAFAEGGPQRVAWSANGEPMMLTGPAEIVCTGEVFEV